MEALRLGYGGIKKICEITGFSEPTVRKGRKELNQDLASRPVDRVRLPGAGRPRVEKKIPK